MALAQLTQVVIQVLRVPPVTQANITQIVVQVVKFTPSVSRSPILTAAVRPIRGFRRVGSPLAGRT